MSVISSIEGTDEYFEKRFPWWQTNLLLIASVAVA